MIKRGAFLLVFAIGLSRASYSQEVAGIDPVKAYEMVRIPGVYLVDVRSIAEYVWVGHPDMAHNIPFAFWNEMKQGMDPNTRFLEDLKARFKPGDTLVFICRSGGRSLKAAQAARSAGFPKVFNVTEGFEGELDGQGHRTVGGWKNNGLPYTFKVDPELMYSKSRSGA